MPMQVSKFKKLPKVTKGKVKMGKKVNWDKVNKFLQDNKELAYTVKEVWEVVKATCMINKDTTISRVRVYKHLQKLVKKGQAEIRDDEGVNVYNWRHIVEKVKV